MHLGVPVARAHRHIVGTALLRHPVGTALLRHPVGTPSAPRRHLVQTPARSHFATISSINAAMRSVTLPK
jgi:hypothetical protein